MLQFGKDNMSDGAKEITSPLIMMTQTPIIVSMALMYFAKWGWQTECSYTKPLLIKRFFLSEHL